ncbi:hypothetical protein JCM4814A_45770 [Streptomyces phaeofaciens JCM 4814]|uniref:Uncharacterized protein n=1 Tax=Streptomyces phaeofaciens TaxID=68254 RepID=A0A918LP09_9ACTN|nr:hypothetical protein GCM10010226_02450 [Streptomyces phaeofaciens]
MELQHRVALVLPYAQVRGVRGGFLLHDDIASNPLHRSGASNGGGVRSSSPLQQGTPDGVNFSMFD